MRLPFGIRFTLPWRRGDRAPGGGGGAAGTGPPPIPADAGQARPVAPGYAAADGEDFEVVVENTSDGGFVHWLLKFYAFGMVALLALGACTVFGSYLYFASTLPELPDLESYRAKVATTTVVRAWDGTPLAELATERREIVGYERIPQRLIEAFLAAEDRRFHEHGGIDYRGIARALGANIRAGEVAQGGSTITQQVAKSFLSAERTLQRKIREAILARRLEARLTKKEILTLYLNQIFLGAGAYGVGGGARRYFDKSVDELDIGEMATLAGLVRAPSRFSPLTNLEAGRARRDQVLTAMVDAGYLPESEATAWKARPLVIRPRADFFRMHAPYFTEQVRRDIARRYGDKKLWEGGLEVETTVIPWIDAAAQENTDFALRKLDKRQGWRGPVARLGGASADAFRRRALERYGTEPPTEGRLYLGLVESVGDKGAARVRVGKGVYPLPAEEMLWAFPFSVKDSTNGRTLTTAEGVLAPGDVVWVKNAHQSRRRRFSDFSYDEKNEVQWLPPYDESQPDGGGSRRAAGKGQKGKLGPGAGATAGRSASRLVTLTLEQTPRVQGAIFSYDHASGYVVAMIGGADYDRSEFNRVTQACRQPGSSYKPIYYSAALDRGYGFSSLLNDVPRAEVDPITGEVWTPTNLNNTVEYQVTLEYSLIWSKNVPSVQIFKLVGGREVEAWARRLGITTPIIPDQALALGASCSRIDEMTRAFSAFARNGVLVDPVYVRRIRDRSGRVVEDNTWVGDPMGRPDDRLDQLVILAGKKTNPVISPRTAWLTSTLLRRVVTRGHAPSIRSAALMAAGKTGTSSATMDVWFIGYTSRWMTTTWVGDDLRERPLGTKDAAFMITVPMFARFINEATVGQPLREVPWERPAGVKPGDTGGKLRTTVDEVLSDGKLPAGRSAKR
jgi:penicillin-binding protein 1A